MQDHFELVQNLADTPLGKHAFYSPRQALQKSKKKKFSTELEDKTTKREDLVLFQRLFSIFERPIRNQESLMNAVVGLNRLCEGKDRNAVLQEVPSPVQPLRPHHVLRLRLRRARRLQRRLRAGHRRRPQPPPGLPTPALHHLRPAARERHARRVPPAGAARRRPN